MSDPQPAPVTESSGQALERQSAEDKLERQFQWFKAHRGGMNFEDIARGELPEDSPKPLVKKKAKEIERSVKEVQAYRNFATAQEVDTTQQHTIVSLAELEKQRLTAALKATRWEEADGKWLLVPDWETQFAAMKLLNEKYGIVAKKNTSGTPMVVAVQQNAGTGAKASSVEVVQSQATSFEDVIRRVQRQRADRDDLPQPVDEGKLLPGVIEGG